MDEFATFRGATTERTHACHGYICVNEFAHNFNNNNNIHNDINNKSNAEVAHSSYLLSGLTGGILRPLR